MFGGMSCMLLGRAELLFEWHPSVISLPLPPTVCYFQHLTTHKLLVLILKKSISTDTINACYDMLDPHLFDLYLSRDQLSVLRSSGASCFHRSDCYNY